MNDALEECAKAALAADFDPVPWDQAPEWRKRVACAVAKAALDTASPDWARQSWLNEMVAMGWRWDKVLDEQRKTHPGIVVGELTRGGTAHWVNVVRVVREKARVLGARMTGS